MELGLDKDKEKQSALLSKVDSAMSLSKHLDKTKENNISARAKNSATGTTSE